jgi:hypothetical protein
MSIYEFLICFISSVALFEFHRVVNLIDTFLNYEDDYGQENEWDEEEEVSDGWGPDKHP